MSTVAVKPHASDTSYKISTHTHIMQTYQIFVHNEPDTYQVAALKSSTAERLYCHYSMLP